MTCTFDLWNISEGCKKNWLFLSGEVGVLCQYLPLIFFSFLLELIRHSDLAFQKQHKGTSATSPKYNEVSLESGLTWIIRELIGEIVTCCAERNN